LAVQPVRRALHRYWARRAARICDAIVAVDSSTADRAARLFGLDAGMFRIVGNGVSTAPVAVQGHRTGHLRVGHVGIVDEGKGWRLTAAAVERLNEGGVAVSLLVAGAGPESAEAAAWCAARPFAEFRGWVENPRETVFPFLDVLVLPSRTEGMPMAVLEALAGGVPVVCTAAGGLPAAVQDGVNGLLVERTSADIRHALGHLAEDEEFWQRLSRGARDTWAQRFSSARMCADYHGVYQAAIAVAGSRGDRR
jgi:glycosyltransferase involved in cell wall biosynthesis